MKSWRRLAPWTAAATLCLVAILIRQFLIQPPEIGQRCESDTLSLFAPGPWWCGARAAVIMTYAWGGLTKAAWFLSIAALILRRQVAGLLALSVGLVAIVWYSYEAGAVAIVIGTLVLARAQVRRA